MQKVELNDGVKMPILDFCVKPKGIRLTDWSLQGNAGLFGSKQHSSRSGNHRHRRSNRYRSRQENRGWKSEISLRHRYRKTEVRGHINILTNSLGP